MTDHDVDDFRLANATVQFADSSRAESQFARVEFLSDGRLKTVQRTPVPADPRYAVDEVTYHAAGTWVAVQPAREGALVVHHGTDPQSAVVACGITKDTVAQHIIEWCSTRTRGIASPDPAKVDRAKLLDTEFDILHRSSGEILETLRFEWFHPSPDECQRATKLIG
jgi:hypothetical protein